MTTTIRSKIGVTLALVLAALSFAPAALADPPQLWLLNNEPAQIKDDPFFGYDGNPFRSYTADAGSSEGATFVSGRERPDGFQPQLQAAREDPLPARGTEFAWRDAAIGGGAGIGLVALVLAAWAIARNGRLAPS